MKLRFSFLALHVLLPVLAGGLIYICWRDSDLFMFRWFGAIGLGTLVNDLRAAVDVVREGNLAARSREVSYGG